MLGKNKSLADQDGIKKNVPNFSTAILYSPPTEAENSGKT